MRSALHHDRDREPDLRIPAVEKVVAIIVVDVDIVGVVPIFRPVFRPRVNKQEREPSIDETWIPHVDSRPRSDAEEVPAAEIDTELVLGNVVAPIAAALRPCAMVRVPMLCAILCPGSSSLPAPFLCPSLLLLPHPRLFRRALRLAPVLLRR